MIRELRASDSRVPSVLLVVACLTGCGSSADERANGASAAHDDVNPVRWAAAVIPRTGFETENVAYAEQGGKPVTGFLDTLKRAVQPHLPRGGP